jgi:hypothetical protein
MQQFIERMVSDFERGRLSRRELIAHLTMLGAGWGIAPMALAQRPNQVLYSQPPATQPDAAPRDGDDPAPPSSTFTATGLNHIALNVTDVPRSRDFYTKHLGLTIQRDGGKGSCFLDCGAHFLALFRGGQPRGQTQGRRTRTRPPRRSRVLS